MPAANRWASSSVRGLTCPVCGSRGMGAPAAKRTLARASLAGALVGGGVEFLIWPLRSETAAVAPKAKTATIRATTIGRLIFRDEIRPFRCACLFIKALLNQSDNLQQDS